MRTSPAQISAVNAAYQVPPTASPAKKGRAREATHSNGKARAIRTRLRCSGRLGT